MEIIQQYKVFTPEKGGEEDKLGSEWASDNGTTEREQIVHLGEALSSIKVENKMVRITVQNNRIVAHDIDLDARFANLHADIAVDKVGRVQVLAEKVRFYCDDLDSIGIDVLVAIDDLLSKDKDYGKAFWKLKKKVERLVATSEKDTKPSR